MGRTLRVLAFAVGALAAALVLVSAAWAVDERQADGRVSRNVAIAGHSVSHLQQHEVAAVVGRLAHGLETADIVVETPVGELRLDAAEIGLRVDRAATIAAALAVGDQGALPLRPLRWAASFARHRRSPVLVTLDQARLAPVVAQRDPTERVEPTEPQLRLTDAGAFEVAAPAPGRGLDPVLVAAAIVDAARSGSVPLRAAAHAVVLPPRFTVDDATPLVAEAERVAAATTTVRAGDQAAEVSGAWAKPHLVLVPAAGRLVLDVSADGALAALAELLPDAGAPPVDAGFEIVADTVRLTPARTGATCCDARAPRLLFDALAAGAPEVTLPLRPAEPDRTEAEAAALGVAEPVATFTTRHACCQGRVTNIHRIAELVRGVVIEPGQSFSLNEHVGRRTRSKGFVDAGVIYNGKFESDVGGGISQFVTTFFNAAFFAGLEFEEYQSHSIYISRYPYGREATISYPKPDFRIRNNTPHGILVWPTYTDSSITVTLWSTKVVDVEQTAQRRRSQGRCTRVTTERTRRWLDGRTEVDNVFAVYRPGEGVSC